jgi:hypothetical protein
MTVRIAAAIGFALLWGAWAWGAPPRSRQIVVDEFGYRVGAAAKVGMAAKPEAGQNADPAIPAPGAAFELRKAEDDAVVLSGPWKSWKDGATDEVSGDRVWTADFSAVNEPGIYYLYDPETDRRSAFFPISADAYRDLLKVATRVFYYQRCSTEIPEEFGGAWTHGPAHLQDGAAERREGGAAAGDPRDVSGGWYDAGDYNKYVPYAAGPLWDLMLAYEMNPGAFGDENSIPESGNGVPDLLDEIKWELDWMLRMQFDDGGVANRVGQGSYQTHAGDPANDLQPRYYTPATSWATASFAAVAAHAAGIFSLYEEAFPGYSQQLLQGATKAWDWLAAHPEITPASGKDGATLAATDAGSNPNADRRARLWAAAELFAATGEPAYKQWFEARYRAFETLHDGNSYPFSKEGGAQFAGPDRARDAVRALVAYARANDADPEVRDSILTVFRNWLDWILLPEAEKESDPYRAFMWTGHYTWGSNNLKANWANLALIANLLNADPERQARFRAAAEEYLHYFHGRNPLNLVMLSNMGDKGAAYPEALSPQEIWHDWFADGSDYDGPESVFGPAPGYVVGGPNQYFASSEFLKSLAPPAGQPPMKSFRDWNTGWNDAARANEESWKITEPAIYYQAAYVLLLSAFQTGEPSAQQ